MYIHVCVLGKKSNENNYWLIRTRIIASRMHCILVLFQSAVIQFIQLYTSVRKTVWVLLVSVLVVPRIKFYTYSKCPEIDDHYNLFKLISNNKTVILVCKLYAWGVIRPSLITCVNETDAVNNQTMVLGQTAFRRRCPNIRPVQPSQTCLESKIYSTRKNIRLDWSIIFVYGQLFRINPFQNLIFTFDMKTKRENKVCDHSSSENV